MIDLHSHTTASDGTFDPEELVALAKKNGIRTFAITDHDTLAGYLSLTYVNDDTFSLVAGAEISCSHTLAGGYGKNQDLTKIIHVVALNIKDVHKMQSALQSVQDSRANRGQRIVQKLSEFLGLDFDMLWQACLTKVGGNDRSLGRPHIGQVLVEFGVVKSISESFDRYLADGKSAYVAIETLTMAQTIALIRDCGGFSVLAHPTRYGLSATRIRRLIDEFSELGGDACELPAPTEPISTRQMIDRCILKNNLFVSVGSDFHGSTMPWRKLGQVAKLNDTQTGIWTKFS